MFCIFFPGGFFLPLIRPKTFASSVYRKMRHDFAIDEKMATRLHHSLCFNSGNASPPGGRWCWTNIITSTLFNSNSVRINYHKLSQCFDLCIEYHFYAVYCYNTLFYFPCLRYLWNEQKLSGNYRNHTLQTDTIHREENRQIMKPFLALFIRN